MESRIGRWFVIGVLLFGLAAAWEGACLVLGFLLVTVPGKAEDNLADQPGPTWVLVLGLALGVVGVAIVCALVYVGKRRGRLLSPGGDGKTRAWMESGRAWGVIIGIASAVPLVFVSVVATHSELRAVPSFVALMLFALGLWFGSSSART